MTDASLPPEIAEIEVDARAPLIVVDVDEVLAMFMRGFGRFVARRGYEMRIDRFALFQNIYPAGAAEAIDLVTGRELFHQFFEADVEHIHAAPGARKALAGLAARATIVVLSNAPTQGRGPRARWLVKRGFPYPLILNNGPKGPALVALAGRTSGPVAFVDDLLPNLESVASLAPEVRRFQHVADRRLRPFAPCDPDRHARIDHWPRLALAIAAALRIDPLR